MLSPDGKLLAFVGQEEGASEIYVMPAEGGSARRLTYLSSTCRVLGWTPAGDAILFTSNQGQPIFREMGLFSVAPGQANGEVTPLPYGPARSIAFGPDGQVVIGRNTGEPARWKRYRGGTAGHLWIDLNGDGEFQRFLADLPGNIASPMWLDPHGDAAASRLFFISDHEGIGNLYSCQPNGADLRRHSDHEDYYARNPSSDGRRIVYHVGADLYVYDARSDSEQRVEVAYHSPRVQRNRKFVHAGRYVDSATLHPSGKAVALTTRGKVYAFYNHEGPVIQHGRRDGVRYRQPDWLNDGRSLIMVSDEPGEEALEIYSTDPTVEMRRLDGLDIGRVVALKVSPADDRVALTNHRHELLVVDLQSGKLLPIDRSLFRQIAGFDWSPDGRWLAYGFGATAKTTEIRLCHLPAAAQKSGTDNADDTAGDSPAAEDGSMAANPEATDGDVRAASAVANGAADAAFTIHTVTQPVLHDVQPAFDPDGKFLYFLSYREFNPVYDSLHFDLGFPWGMRPYLLTLRTDLPNPFVPRPELEDDEDDPDDGNSKDEEEDEGAEEEGDGSSHEEDEVEDEYGEDDDGDEDGDEAEDDELGEPIDDEIDFGYPAIVDVRRCAPLLPNFRKPRRTLNRNIPNRRIQHPRSQRLMAKNRAMMTT
ncbi:MAG: hypothetical protein HC802_16225 [Caldilineaceae bacterium]|nr:hypothetical protein [Caldilineaceae bacterium]